MPFPRNSLRAFLQHAKSSLPQALNGKGKVNIVIGNQSADLDSLTSSLLFAYLRSIAPPRDTFAPLYVPLLNIPSSDLRLRPEFSAVCRHANITPSDLITLDDISNHPEPLQNVQFILVDHNRLDEKLGKVYSSNVRGVIDHHEEEGVVPQETDPEPRIVEKSGSCTSLVVRYCKPAWDNISSSSLSSGAAHGQGEVAVDDSAVTQSWDAQIAKIALASILIDTANLTAPGKVEVADREAVEYLEAKIQLSPNHARTWNRDKYHKEIDEANRDLDALTLDELLQKDYKQWTENGENLGISSVVKPLDYLTGKVNYDQYQLQDRLWCFMGNSGLSVLAIMTTSTSAEGEFKRELLVQAKRSSFTVLTDFIRRAAPVLQLEVVCIEKIATHDDEPPKSGAIWRKTWLQRDVSKSRKQVAPLLRESMRVNDS